MEMWRTTLREAAEEAMGAPVVSPDAPQVSAE